ncbi:MULTISPECIES: GGDEF domain-containing protein [Acinetobacter]|jgi:diguanylate cyclase (GGDEF)-like protein|uniref:GGDEF domain-containing protein n=1 Tax=Acinetobacter TaxID=469 RepID=UPI000662BBDB|nr:MULTISPECIES: GGDEF domain-containing protein [Acinetobacter]KMU99193.1 diguanylate cyclase [Acinetobacter sp. VT 511]MCU4323098.1 GGDEF domain-containing protein [Acinetobacter schindleri]PUR00518.1 GGDEF domain-containing protein [Acinetobacter schindleri]
MNTLRSEQISKHLYCAMSVIILCLLFICIPLIVNSTQSYLKAVRTSDELHALQEVAILANKISKERAPANKVLSSTPEEIHQRQQELEIYRKEVDQQFEHTAKVLQQVGFPHLSQRLESTVRPSLEQGRLQIDRYAKIPWEQRNAQALDQAIAAMFKAWDSCRTILKGVVIASNTTSTSQNNFISQILFLSDLRDQAGRAASTIMAYVTFDQPIPAANLTRAMQVQYRIHYLWDLIGTLQPEEDKTEEFNRLHNAVDTVFIQKGLPIVSSLVEESIQQVPYHLTGTELTNAMVDKFATVVDLQSYLLEYSNQVAEREKSSHLQQLLWTVLLSFVSLGAAIATMIFARKSVFQPLIEARQILFTLSENGDTKALSSNAHTKSESLFTAIQRLQQMLQQRDALEFRLKNIAHSDPLTGLANRFALEEYTRFLESHPSQFSQTCLMIIDIDHFKQVNDQYGHIIGDEVIQFVAQCLKDNVRTSDLLVRYGGDEFLVLIENIDFDNARKIADKIRSEVEGAYILSENGDQIQVSVSVGVAIGAQSWISLFTKADKALFVAKGQGRNAVAEV